ncbi:MAG TPA: tRNA (N6-threonylcarbamoyladenosine(37)-N6)-methyltransferase TrmO [Candidatus Deferrimicrobiaceae bacterium]|jgi:L-fuculose-phosphate aldolase
MKADPREPVISFALRPIGEIRSPIKKPGDAPFQGALSDVVAEVVLDPAYVDGLKGMSERVNPSWVNSLPDDRHRRQAKIVVLCWMHGAERERLLVHPRGDTNRGLRGVFATRSPHRPNPISLHTVTLLEIRGNVLRVRGMDAIDGTPVIDIKPHAPELDG